MIRVLIVDDHPIVREGVAAVLERERDIEVVGAAGTIEEGLRLTQTLHPDVVLLDLRMPDTNQRRSESDPSSAAHRNRGTVRTRADATYRDDQGPDDAGSVTRFAGESRAVVVFSAYDADDDVFRAIRGGARGYLLKGSPAAEIAQAIRKVHAGESHLSPRVAAKLVAGVAQPRASGGLLSARERGVLRLVAAGLSNRQIAQTLSISERTVKFHVTAIFNKLGADNRAQAVAVAAERGLLSR
jgi:DNA-binding NarL/FixJ family response regulator